MAIISCRRRRLPVAELPDLYAACMTITRSPLRIFLRQVRDIRRHALAAGAAVIIFLYYACQFYSLGSSARWPATRRCAAVLSRHFLTERMPPLRHPFHILLRPTTPLVPHYDDGDFAEHTYGSFTA